MGGRFIIREKDGSGRVTALYRSDADSRHNSTGAKAKRKSSSKSKHSWRHFWSHVFLPEGYPATVSEDYLQYQIWNVLQSFCSSLASLFASRAVLQGHGVGDASASATDAILLTIIQDVFSRFTTIIAGYCLGTFLYPEAKTYRLLADVLLDIALITDTLSPHLASVSLSIHYPFLLPATDSSLRVVALCMSGAFRALCGAVAGGSKAALTVHFATAGEKPGDVGDLSAKDGSKETVLALLGMLCGSVLVRYVHSSQATYAVLFVLIFGHIATNYMAVRVVSMRTLNRQRASIAWLAHSSSRVRIRHTYGADADSKDLLPNAVSARERIFTDSSWIQVQAHPPARCTIGVPFASIRQPSSTAWNLCPTIPMLSSRSHLRHKELNAAEIVALFQVFANERYVLWYASEPRAPVRLFVGLKEGHGPRDHLKAWAHAHELVRVRDSEQGDRTPSSFDEQLEAVRATLEIVGRIFPGFVEVAKEAGWKIDEGVLVAGSPVTMSMELLDDAFEDKKDI